MQFKSITAITVLTLMVASLFVAGCTNNTTNQTPSASTATHDAFLEKYLAEFKNETHSRTDQSFKAWEVTWVNSTSARLQLAFLNKSTNRTASTDINFLVFPTTQDATNYLNAMNKTAYSLASTTYGSGGIYQNVTGHAPQIYKAYEWNEGNQYDISEYKFHQIQQFDNLIIVTTGKWLTTA